MQEKPKVVVALSGGVDSSVSAALLQSEGYEVHGAFIRTWSPPWVACTWREERLDAMRICAQLSIPFHTVDLSKEYEREVVAYMVSAYARGETPNPDVMCNKHIKFGGFFDWARGNGFAFVATGHYAQVQHKSGKSFLCTAVDTQKDQTYFLWTLTQEHLTRTLFPVGHLTKTQVRAHAEKYNLVTAQKKDSQGICFLGKVDMKEFLQHYIPKQSGRVLNEEGDVIGVHDGAVFYTLGQRHGFTIQKKSPDTPALFVVEKNVQDNTLIVAPKYDDGGTHEETHVEVSDVSFTTGSMPDTFSCDARFRYRQPVFPVTVTKKTNKTVHVVFSKPQAYVAKGQSIVLYDENVCLGGGIIV